MPRHDGEYIVPDRSSMFRSLQLAVSCLIFEAGESGPMLLSMLAKQNQFGPLSALGDTILPMKPSPTPRPRCASGMLAEFGRAVSEL